jgi:hypothetical protein
MRGTCRVRGLQALVVASGVWAGLGVAGGEQTLERVTLSVKEAREERRAEVVRPGVPWVLPLRVVDPGKLVVKAGEQLLAECFLGWGEDERLRVGPVTAGSPVPLPRVVSRERGQEEVEVSIPAALEGEALLTLTYEWEWKHQGKPALVRTWPGVSRRPPPLQRYLDFIRRREEELASSGAPERERRVRHAALHELMSLALTQAEQRLAMEEPSLVYEQLRAKHDVLEQREGARKEAVERKLDEYWSWAFQVQKEGAGKFSSAGSAYLVTESPLRVESIDVLIRAVLDWAYDNEDSPVFLRRSPSEVALYLLAKSDALATVVALGQTAPAHLDYSPQFDRSLYTAGDAVLETVVGVIPVVGNVSDAAQALDGTSLTGHELETSDRVVLMVGALLPLAKLKKVEGLLGALVTATGRNVHEIEAVFRIAQHLTPEEVAQVDRIVKTVAAGGKLHPEQLAALNRVVVRLEEPIRELAKLLRQGRKVTADAVTGAKLIPGTSEHLVQRWLDYQFLHLERYRSLRKTVDPKWQEAYWRILANNEAGSAFQADALRAMKLEKNTALLMPPPGQGGVGFIPDAVRGHKGELVWGQAYDFVEVKGRKEMSWTGNLTAMIQYVESYGGSIRVVFRSAKHPDGMTKLSERLEGEIEKLKRAGKARVSYYP